MTITVPLFSDISREAMRLTELLGWDPLPSEQNSALRHESAVYSRALKATLAHLTLALSERDDAHAKLDALWSELQKRDRRIAQVVAAYRNWLEAPNKEAAFGKLQNAIGELATNTPEASLP